MLSQLCWAGNGDKIAGSQDAESTVLGRAQAGRLTASKRAESQIGSLRWVLTRLCSCASPTFAM